METSNRIGNPEWCQSCLKRRVNKGYNQCLFCQREMTKETIDYYKLGHREGYVAEQLESLSFGVHKSDDIEKQRLSKIPEKSKDDYILGFLDGQNEYQNDYSMNAAFGFDL